MFVIEDEWHSEDVGVYSTKHEALAELDRLAQTPWDEDPNRAPCQSWRTCGRRYELIEYDDLPSPWRELSRRPVLEVSNAGVTRLD